MTHIKWIICLTNICQSTAISNTFPGVLGVKEEGKGEESNISQDFQNTQVKFEDNP